jgi:hypothetical protein
LSLASGAPAGTGGPAANMPTQNTGVSHEITLGEEEISDVSLSTFYDFDKENAGTSRPGVQLAYYRGCRRGCRGCGGWHRGCGVGWRGCGGCGGCEAAATGAGGAAFGPGAFINIARSLPRLHFNMAPAAVKPRPRLRPVGTLRREATFRQRSASIPSTPPTRLVQPDPVFLQRSGFLLGGRHAQRGRVHRAVYAP